MFDKLKTVEKRYNDLNELLSDPKIIAQQSEFQKYAKEQSELAPIVNRFQDLKKFAKQLEESRKYLRKNKTLKCWRWQKKILLMLNFKNKRLKKI